MWVDKVAVRRRCKSAGDLSTRLDCQSCGQEDGSNEYWSHVRNDCLEGKLAKKQYVYLLIVIWGYFCQEQIPGGLSSMYTRNDAAFCRVLTHWTRLDQLGRLKSFVCFEFRMAVGLKI